MGKEGDNVDNEENVDNEKNVDDGESVGIFQARMREQNHM